MNTVSHIATENENEQKTFFKSLGACAPTMYRPGKSLFKSMGVWAPTMYGTGESFFKGMDAWAPMTFSKGNCEKCSFENHGCQGTHVRTVSFLDNVQ